MGSGDVFHIADYVVFVITIVISLGIGIFYALSGGRQRTTSEFLVGNRKMTVLPVAISLMVSFESSIMMLGFPAEVYTFWNSIYYGNFRMVCGQSGSSQNNGSTHTSLKITSAYEVQ